jgi:drug/metabolite transporter (DMT)-like permease
MYKDTKITQMKRKTTPHSLKMLDTIRTIIIFSMSSEFGLIFAFIFLNEPISTYQIIAVIAMLASIYTVNRKNGNREKQEKNTH